MSGRLSLSLILLSIAMLPLLSQPGASAAARMAASPRSLHASTGTAIPHAMGIVASRKPGFFLVAAMNPMANPRMNSMINRMKTIRIGVIPRSRFFLLSPFPLSKVRAGWQAHAIGPIKGRDIQTRLLVVFPPASRAGVPPPAAGMTGVGRLVSLNPLRLAIQGGQGTDRVLLDPDARIEIARPIPYSRLHPGDQAMTFGSPGGGSLTAAIVHVHAAVSPPNRRKH